MIAYFSATGNTRLVARMIAETTGDTAEYIPGIVSSGRGYLKSDRPFVIVTPIFAWRIPRYVEDFVRNTEFKGDKGIYFVVTCGGEAAKADRYIRRLCEDKGLDLLGIGVVVMPDNYIVLFDPVDEDTARRMILDAVPVIDDISDRISGRRPLEYVTKGGLMKSTLVNSLFMRCYTGGKGFRSTDGCTGCGSCIGMCPVDAISLEDGRPVWGGSCMQCLACLNRCPEQAIEFKRRTVGRRRYVCPFDDPSELRE